MEIRALELNSSSSIFNPERILDTLKLLNRADYTTLVLHDVPIMEELIWPATFFGVEGVTGAHRRYREGFKQFYRYNPRRRPMPYHNLDYMRWIARRAHEHGLTFYLNNKELYFPDAIIEFNPHLVKNGKFCPSEPFWEEFIETKYDELFTDFPELDGTITAPGSGESRLAMSSSRCDCELCAQTSIKDWYLRIIGAMHRAATRHGKHLIIRDFVFDRHDQEQLAEALVDLPEDITICLKNTPHDYYPTFPDNPRIGEVGPHDQWVEFDALGQYFGWGMSPAIMTADMRQRIAYAHSRGAHGVLIRIDWEALQGFSARKSVNAVNIYAMGMLGADVDRPNRDIYARWAEEVGALRQDLGPKALDGALAWIETTLESMWPITMRTLYAHGTVFSDSTYYPVSVEHAYWLAEEKNSLKDWDPEAADRITPGADNVRDLLAEKAQAVAMVRDLEQRVIEGHPGINPAWLGELHARMRLFRRYVEGYEVIAQGIFCARHATHMDNPDPELIVIGRNAITGLSRLAEEFRASQEADSYPAMMLLNGDRLDALREDLEGHFATVED